MTYRRFPLRSAVDLKTMGKEVMPPAANGIVGNVVFIVVLYLYDFDMYSVDAFL